MTENIFGKNVFNVAHVSSANTEAGFMTYTAASHQSAMDMFWLHFWGCHSVCLNIQSMIQTLALYLTYRHDVDVGLIVSFSERTQISMFPKTHSNCFISSVTWCKIVVASYNSVACCNRDSLCQLLSLSIALTLVSLTELILSSVSLLLPHSFPVQTQLLCSPEASDASFGNMS